MAKKTLVVEYLYTVEVECNGDEEWEVLTDMAAKALYENGGTIKVQELDLFMATVQGEDGGVDREYNP